MIFNTMFASFLMQEKKLKDVELKDCLARANHNSTPLYLELIKANVLKEEAMFILVARFLGIPYRFYQLSETKLELVKRFSREKLIEFNALPMDEDEKTLTMLCSNPFRFEDIKELYYDTPKEIKFVLTIPSQMTKLLDYMNNKVQQNLVLEDYSEKDADISEIDSTTLSIDAPVIKLCDSILKEAVSRGASDIHIEPFEDILKIRFRLDGKLKMIDEIPNHLYPAILARYKIMSGLNIAERRIPQDGKINLEILDQSYDFRVSTIPTIHGEKLVIRIYNITLSSTDLSRLGFSAVQNELVMKMISRPHGIILLTGPTGSGKSTTLYSFLRNLNTEDTNIITVEDPVENVIDGINQVQVNPKANLTFATALRSILRQDPNVIMIGEIRDEETAQIATRAAITGHLVLSSIHTNDAAGVVARLMNMGIPKYLIADSLLGAISQRLVRKLCPKCRRRKKTSEADIQLLKLESPQMIYQAQGCPYCNHTGYLGRVGVFEIMIVDDSVRNMIMSPDFTTEGLNDLLSNNMATLLFNARQRVLNGETTIEEYEKLDEVIEQQV